MKIKNIISNPWQLLSIISMILLNPTVAEIVDLGKNYTKDSATNTIYYGEKPIKVYSPDTFKILPKDHKRGADYDAVDAYVLYKNGNIVWSGYDRNNDDVWIQGTEIGPSQKTVFDDSWGIPIDCHDAYEKPAKLFQCYQTYVYPEQWAEIPALNPEEFTTVYRRTSRNKWYIRDNQYLIKLEKDKDVAPSIYFYLGKKYSPREAWTGIYYSDGEKIFYEDSEIAFELEEADFNTLEVLAYPPYSKDKNHVYYYEQKLDDLIQDNNQRSVKFAPQTFRILNFDTKNWLSYHNALLVDQSKIYFIKKSFDNPEQAFPISLPVNPLSLEEIQNDVSNSIFVRSGTSVFYIFYNEKENTVLPIELKNIDISSFQILKHDLIKYKDAIYYINRYSKEMPLVKIDFINASTFEFYKDNDTFARDKNRLYYIKTQNNHEDNFVTVLTEADAQTFQFIPETYGKYAKDRNSVYRLKARYQSKDAFMPIFTKLEGVDALTFEILNANQPAIARDKNNIYTIKGASDKDADPATRLMSLDAPTFEMINANPFEAQDKNGIYNGSNIFPITKKLPNIRNIKYNNTIIDGKALRVLDEGYRHTYIEYEGKVLFSKGYNYEWLEDADPSTFTFIGTLEDTTLGLSHHYTPDNYSYWKDKNNVYIESKSTVKKLGNADPATFKLLNYPYTKDKNLVFSHDSAIFTFGDSIAIDPETFDAIYSAPKIPYPRAQSMYQRNTDKIYYNTVEIEGVDHNTFEVLAYPYAKDHNSVYYQGKVIPDFSSQGFTIDSELTSIAHNDHQVIHQDYILEKLSAETLQVQSYDKFYSVALIKDANTIYFINNSSQLTQIHLDPNSTTSQSLWFPNSADHYLIKDKNHTMIFKNNYDKLTVYKIPNVDASSFQILSLSKGLAKDKNSVYLLTEGFYAVKLPELDATSFDILNRMYDEKDDYAIYKNGIYLLKDFKIPNRPTLNYSAQSLISKFDLKDLKAMQTKPIRYPKQDKTTSTKKFTKNFDPNIDIPTICREHLNNPSKLLQCFQNLFYPDLWAKAPTLNPEKFKIFGKTKDHWYIGDDQYVLSFGEDDDYWHKHGNLYDRTPYRNYYQLFHHKDIADPATFEIIADDLAKDKHHTYSIRYVAKKMPTPVLTVIKPNAKTNIETQKPIQKQKKIPSWFSQDKDHVYYNGERIEIVDPSSFEIIDYRYSKDKNHVFYEESGKLHIFENVDPQTFIVLDDSYRKDKNNVFFSSSRSIIPNADPATFEVLGNWSAKDKSHVYFGNITMKGADPNTYEEVNDLYSKDKQLVFYNYLIVDNADASTFEGIDDQHIANNLYKDRYASDKNHVFYSGRIFKNADPKTFELLPYGFTKDKNYVFYHQKIIEGVDIQSFTQLPHYFFKDDHNVYYLTHSITHKAEPPLDPNTFEIIDNEYAEDKNGRYLLDNFKK